MRLLNVKTKNLEEFFEKSIPKYAILSHTWGENEVTFREFDVALGPRRASAKIDGCCAQALKNGFDYVWIDTCCIDNSSSTELSEAINSMFAWYERAVICYVYLSDVYSHELNPDDEHSEFSKSRWFTRGWALQELLAPDLLMFFSASWHPLGRLGKRGKKKHFGNPNMPSYLGKITKIPLNIIDGEKTLNMASIAMRMSWASARETTRVEDMAYCLLGMFDIAMPILYGEGTKGFMRLQEEIMKNKDDHSIFAWGFGTIGGRTMSCFASSPAEFAGCNELQYHRSGGTHSGHVVMTNKGLSMEMSIIRLTTGDYIGRLNSEISPNLVYLAIPLVRYRRDENVFYRPEFSVPQRVSWYLFHNVSPKPIYISKSTPKLVRWSSGIRLSRRFLANFDVREVHPPNWNLRLGSCYTSSGEGIEGKDRTILLDCSNKRGEIFVLRVDYTFQIVHSHLFVSFIRPVAAKVLASQLPLDPGRSLLEIIASHGDQVDEMMDWREDMVLERVEASHVDGEICGGFTRRLHLDGSERNRWKIDIVDVSDSYVGEDPVKHSLIGEPCDSDDGADYPESDSNGSDYNDSDSNDSDSNDSDSEADSPT